MKRFATAAPLIVLTACTLSAFLSTITVPMPAFAAQEETVTETISLTFIKPSALLNSLKESAPDKKTMFPAGIIGTVPSDTAKTLTVTGTKTAVAEMQQIARLLDVKPREIVLKTRLVETRIEANGQRKKTVLQTSELRARNNQLTRTTIGGSEGSDGEEISVQLTPHINGDHSVSFLAQLQRQLKTGDRKLETGTNIYRRFSKPNEWNAFSVISLPGSLEQQNLIQSKATPSSDTYPLYTLEVLFTEVADS